MGPTLGFDKKQRNSFLIKFGVLYNKNKILTILFIVWKELTKYLVDVSSNVWSTDLSQRQNLTTSTLSSCTCSFEGQATLNEYL
jgi:hypothetical protein